MSADVVAHLAGPDEHPGMIRDCVYCGKGRVPESGVYEVAWLLADKRTGERIMQPPTHDYAGRPWRKP